MVYINSIHISVLAFSLLCTSCDKAPNISKVSGADEERVRKIGKKVTGLLLTTLQSELKQTIEDKGMVAALSICNSKAIFLTDSLTESIDEIIDIKRTSWKYRNPKNAPDSYERKVLAFIQKSFNEDGILPEELIEKIDEGNKTHFRYYKPLTVKPLCLNCHGQKEMMTPNISYNIRRLYPKDQATGYSNEQFRGLIRISIR